MPTIVDMRPPTNTFRHDSNMAGGVLSRTRRM